MVAGFILRSTMGDIINGQFNLGLNLKAKTPTEQRILEYLEENASPTLTAKINDGHKTLKGSFDYCQKEAKKLVKGGAGGIMVEDATVFGWIIHYFEEDSIKEDKPKKAKKKVKLPGKAKAKAKAKPKKKAEPIKASKGSIVRDLFDEFDAFEPEEKDPF